LLCEAARDLFGWPAKIGVWSLSDAEEAWKEYEGAPASALKYISFRNFVSVAWVVVPESKQK
jgi:hypothetical protein